MCTVCTDVSFLLLVGLQLAGWQAACCCGVVGATTAHCSLRCFVQQALLLGSARGLLGVHYELSHLTHTLAYIMYTGTQPLLVVVGLLGSW